MSLNGLDTLAVKEAYEAAVSEAGGWFLLKYASRDEVDLFAQGMGGIEEMRNAISQYEEASPLYGFLRYRRRNVVIKYLPDNCSRLIQARVVVHFNAVSEKFSPYDATLAVSAAKEMKDTKLSAACSLHATSSSTSSISSLRRRHLIEIAEEEEEQQLAAKRQSTVTGKDRPTTREGLRTISPTSSLVVLDSELATTSDASRFANTTEPPAFLSTETPPSPNQSYDARRLSSQLSHTEMLGYAYSYGKPKVKIAPRPSLDTSGRPRTSAGTGQSRPVSSIPAGFKLMSKGSRRGRDVAVTESSYHPEEEKPGDLPAVADAIPTDSSDPKQPHTSSDRPVTSSGLSVSSVAATLSAPETKRSHITPEMARLKKAMKLRERRMNAVPPPRLSPIVDTAAMDGHTDGFSQNVNHTEPILDNIGNAPSPDDEQSLIDHFPIPDATSADSAIDIGLFTIDHASVDTQTTDSHPASPLIPPSEIGDSTKASSLIESTDETIQTLHESGADPDAIRTGGIELQVADGSIVFEKKTTGPDANLHSKRPDIGSQMLSDGEALSKTTGKSVAMPEITAPDDAGVEGEAKVKVPGVVGPTPMITKSGPCASRSAVDLEDSDASTDAKGTKGTKRTAIIEPIWTDLSSLKEATQSEANLSDDEDLMEELQSATVQQAKPVTVSKSPVASVFPNLSPLKQFHKPDADNHLGRTANRTASNPIRGSFLAPGDATSTAVRAASSGAVFIQRIAQQPAHNLTSKKSNIGSSISQRIKALEKLSESARAATSDGSTRLERPSSTFFSVRKTSGRETFGSAPVLDRATPLKRDESSSPPSSRESSPEIPRLAPRDRSGSVASRLSVFEGGNVPRGRPESIQVRARILRDPTHPLARMAEPHADSVDFGLLELKQSPLIVDHQKATPASGFGSVLEAAEAKRASIQERRHSQSHDGPVRGDDDYADDMCRRRRSSLSIVRDFIKDRRVSAMGGRSPSTDNLNGPMSSTSLATPSKSPSRPPSVHTTTGLARRLSVSSRRSSTSKDRDLTPTGVPLSPSLMTEASGSGDESRPSTSDPSQKGSVSVNKSRTGRFMKRLSSSFSSGRKTTTPTISPTVTEEEEIYNMAPASRGSMAVPQPSIVSYMGDVNVQFPDNLLWKRRTMCLDSHGFLILSALNGTTAAASLGGRDGPTGAIKRYHLRDFRLPYIPEMEVQELPNSVCLDFVDGSGLQIACEDRSGQASVLHVLLAAHQNHTSFGQ